MRRIGDESVIHAFVRNLRTTPSSFRESLLRHGAPTSRRTRSEAVFKNFFLHVLPVRTHSHSLKPRTTLGLGVITLVLFAIEVITGLLLMVYYKPSVREAYGSMVDIMQVVPNGDIIRNVHRWAAHGMVACVLAHMARVMYTSAYKRSRQFNWVVGMALLVLTLGLSFTGYLLPWDQLAYWATTIGSNIAQSPRELTDAIGVTPWFDIGGLQKSLLLGAHHVGQEALTRFFVLHVILLPIIITVTIAVHVWRIRKDGGLARPASADRLVQLEAPRVEPRLKTYGLMAVVRGKAPNVDREMANTFSTWPNALYAIGAVAAFTSLVVLVLGMCFDAPLREMANPAVPENPAKAPWYFLGLQELVSYSAFMGGVGIPSIVVLGLALVPYLDREQEDVGVWFSGKRGRRVALSSALFTLIIVVALLWFTVSFGWMRDWPATRSVPQIVITFLNPGTLLVAFFASWSLLVMLRTRSTRFGAIAVFTCFLMGYVILTWFATMHRGPNWSFYWWPSQWPH